MLPQSESGNEIDEVMHLKRDEFIGIMLRMHQSNSSKKWSWLVKLQKWKNLTLLFDFCPICGSFKILGQRCWDSSLVSWERNRKIICHGAKTRLFTPRNLLKNLWDITISYRWVKNQIIQLSRHFEDHWSQADVKKKKRDPPFYHAVVKKVADTKASGRSDLAYAEKPGKMVIVYNTTSE